MKGNLLHFVEFGLHAGGDSGRSTVRKVTCSKPTEAVEFNTLESMDTQPTA